MIACFVFEQKGTLRELLDASPQKLQLHEQTRIIKQLVFGLSYLHPQKVAHRDFKSLQVLIDERLVLHLVKYPAPFPYPV